MADSASQLLYQAPTYFPVPFHLQNAYLAASYVTPAPVSAAASASVALVVAPVYPVVHSFPQNQQAQQLFRKDAQTITPEVLATVKAALASSTNDLKVQTKKKGVPRKATGKTWEDPTLADWPEKCAPLECDRSIRNSCIQIFVLANEMIWDNHKLLCISKTFNKADSCGRLRWFTGHQYWLPWRDDFRLFCGDLGNEVNADILSKAFSRYPSFNKVVRDKWTGKTKGYGFVSFANASDLAAAMKEMNGKYVGNRPIKLQKSTWTDRIDYEAYEKQKNQAQKKRKAQKKGILHK